VTLVKIKFLSLSFAALAMLAGKASAAGINLIQNGSFESTTFSGSDYFGHNGNTIANWGTPTSTTNFLYFSGTQNNAVSQGGGNTFKLWTLANGGNTAIPNSSPDGGNFIVADGDPSYSAALTQTINGLVAGQSYSVTFYQAAGQQFGYTGDTTERWQVSLGSESHLSDLMTNPSHSFQPWEQETLTFTATSSSEVLTFLSKGTPSGVPPVAFLDGVSLEANTPEPSYLAIAGFALLGVSALRRQRRKRS
jgi:hypothetical protein